MLLPPHFCRPQAGHAVRSFHLSHLWLLWSLTLLQIVSPFKDGILNDWEAVDGILDHALK